MPFLLIWIYHWRKLSLQLYESWFIQQKNYESWCCMRIVRHYPNGARGMRIVKSQYFFVTMGPLTIHMFLGYYSVQGDVIKLYGLRWVDDPKKTYHVMWQSYHKVFFFFFFLYNFFLRIKSYHNLIIKKILLKNCNY